MSSPPLLERLWIVGAGRAGLALGLLLRRAGAAGSLVVTGRRRVAPSHPLFAGPEPLAAYTAVLAPPSPAPTAVVIAVPDTALAGLAARLAALPLPTGTPVLHLSGALGAAALEPLRRAGCATGALHPLAAIADPVTGAERLRGVYWGVEAEGAARALAEAIVAAAAGQALPVAPGNKPLYHAAAVMAANFVVALLGAAERVMVRAGVDPPAARAALTTLAAGAVANVASQGPATALTGPIARGDEATVALHLAHLSEPERALYSPLARAALALAREAGLADDAVRRIELLLEDEG